MNKKILIVGVITIVMAMCLCGCSKKKEEKTTDTSVLTKENIGKVLKGKHKVEIEVIDYGTIKVELDADKAPVSVTNFVNLANDKFYDGLTFHRIISGFMIQGGDPNGDGTGGSDRNILGEFEKNNVENDLKHTRGAISMARAQDNNSASSQFFIVHKDAAHLNGEYAVFGYVTEGMEVVDDICSKVSVSDSNGLVDAENQPTIKTVKVVK